MEKNYYKILEIDKDASPEIIKKAYTTLAKKYHPDLQDESVKHIYEEKLKLINEAYEVLSNEEKRKQYDLELARKEPNTEDLLNENITLKNELNNFKKNHNINSHSERQKNTYEDCNQNNSNQYQEELLRQQQLEYQRQVQQAKEKAYYDTYIQDLKNRGYKIRYKKTFSDYVKNFIALSCTIFILFLLWQLPFVKSFFINIYNQNPIIKFLVDFIENLFDIF